MGNETLSRTAHVVVTATGMQIPPCGDHEGIPLRRPELEVLHRLCAATPPAADELAAEVAGRTGCALATPTTFLTALRARGLLVRPHDRGPTPRLTRAPQLAPPAFGEDDLLVARSPFALRCTEGGFEIVGHSGASVGTLSPLELLALSTFVTPRTLRSAHESHVEDAGPGALSDAEMREVVDHMMSRGIIGPAGEGTAVQSDRTTAEVQAIVAMMRTTDTVFSDVMASHLAAEDARRKDTGTTRVRVVPVHTQPGFPPLALGMVIGSAMAHEDGWLSEVFDFVPDWVTTPARLDEYAREPAIFLFSNYVWSHDENLRLSARIKELNPDAITIHGGPDTPRYERDTEAYFARYPHVDIAVHGEGEATCPEMLAALVGVFDHERDLSALADVAGLSYRDGDRVVRTRDRDRLTDLDLLPSPYLGGLFQTFDGAPVVMAIIETNRGCPYGCTFCDWGSATLSRIRKFSLDRVFAELEWCAKNGVKQIFIADANFGIFERDVEIAARVAELKSMYGFPQAFYTNYAKNTVKHLKQIVDVMVRAEIMTEGLLSLQTMDEGTLATIKRSNIKVAKYDDLAMEFRRAGLPLFVDIMLGLPGSTTASFQNDLQQCIDREVTAKIFQTELLSNSPMNAPEYRSEQRIEVAPAASGFFSSKLADDGGDGRGRKLVVATASFTRDDYLGMLELRSTFRLFENYGVLRHVSRFVRQEAGIREIDLFDDVRRAATRTPDRWPLLTFAVRSLPEVMLPPVSWTLFMGEVEEFLAASYDLPDSSGLRTVLAAQAGLLPSVDRTFPDVLELPHDVAAWHSAMLTAKDSGHRTDWTDVVPRLETFGPTRFEISDPNRVCETGLGFANESHFYGDWELASPVSRAMPALHLVEI